MNHRNKRKQGQAVVEYLVLVAVLSTVTITFVNFLVQSVFQPGLELLPSKMEQCLSTGGTRGGSCN